MSSLAPELPSVEFDELVDCVLETLTVQSASSPAKEGIIDITEDEDNSEKLVTNVLTKDTVEGIRKSGYGSPLFERCLAQIPKSNRVDTITDHFKVLHILGKGVIGEVACITPITSMHGTLSLTNDSSLSSMDDDDLSNMIDAWVSEAIVTHESLQQEYAMKQFSKRKKGHLRCFLNESSMLPTLNHPNIANFCGVCCDTKYFYLLTEVCIGRTLTEHLNTSGKFNGTQATKIMRILLSTMLWLHRRNIVHRDIKLSNIVMNNMRADNECEVTLKIIDFADSTNIKDELLYPPNLRSGTLLYLTPEVDRYRYGWEMKKADIWALGIVCFALVTAKMPSYGFGGKIKTIDELLSKIRWHRKIPIPRRDRLSDHCRDFIHSLTHINPQTRYTATQALGHRWLTRKQK